MALVLTVAVGAFLVGRLAGGTLPRLLSVRPRSARLLVVTVAFQALGGLLATLVAPAYGLATALSGIFVAVFGLRNRAVPGIPLVAAGLLCNVAVIVANGAMPVSSEAAERAGVVSAGVDLSDDPGREVAGRQTHLWWLAEVIPVASPLRREVASPGDVLVSAGVALYVVTGMNRPRRRMRPEVGPRQEPTAARAVDASYATM